MNITFNRNIMYFLKNSDKGIALIKVEKEIETNNYNAVIYSTYSASNNEFEDIIKDEYLIDFEKFNILYDKYKSEFI